MKRYYLSKVVGPNEHDDGWHAAIDEDPTPKRAVYEIPTDPTTGLPTVTSVLCLIAAADHRTLLQRADSDPLPIFPLDGRVAAIKAATVAALRQTMVRHGLASSLVDGADGFRDLIRAVGRRGNANFDENNFDVEDVT